MCPNSLFIYNSLGRPNWVHASKHAFDGCLFAKQSSQERVDKDDQPFMHIETHDKSLCRVVKSEIVLLKWRLLCLACMITFGAYYVYDFPSSIGSGSGATIEHKFRTHGKEYTQTMNQALYSVYNWPNTVMAIVGGLLIDKILGLRRATLLFSGCVTVGSVLFYLGVVSTSYPLMLVGRTVYGLGGDCLSVSQSAAVTRWFKGGRGIALAFGITVSFSRVGSSFNFLISPPAASRWGIDAAVLLGVATCVVSFACAAALVAMDVYGTRRGIVPTESKETSTPFRFSDVKRFPLLHWVVLAVCMTGYCAILPFIGIAVNYFQVQSGLSQDDASFFVSFYQLTSALGAAVVGGVVEYYGRLVMWVIASFALFTTFHVLLLSVAVHPALIMPAFGVAYSLMVASLWPMVPLVSG